jgi:hypothetical protein
MIAVHIAPCLTMRQGADMCIAPCRQQVEKKTVLENLDLVLLAIDETVDGG